MLLLLAGLVLAGLIAPSGATAQAQYQVALPAVITRVVDGDTVRARLGDGRMLTVRLIGIDAPETGPRECGAKRATAYLRRLVLGKSVVLNPDPTQGAVDRLGRLLYYVDRADGLDAGRAVIRVGLAKVFEATEVDFGRYDAYVDAKNRAFEAGRGVWDDCGGDFHFTRREQLRERRREAAAFVRGYYSAISQRRFSRAWRRLGRRVRRRQGPFASWRAGYRRSLSTRVRTARVRLSGRRAVVTVSLRSRDRDACNGRVVRQSFRARWVLAPRRGSWVAVRLRARKTGGGRVRIRKSECPRPKPRPAPPAPQPQPQVDCQGYSPCLPPGPDVDCAGGSGDGPRYVDGPVSVTGSDPYDLDRDGDGSACES